MSAIQLKNIKKVVILDDDWACQFNINALRSSGINVDVLDRLEDRGDKNTREYVNLLAAHNVPHGNIDDLINAFGMPHLYDGIPQYYKVNLIDIHRANFEQKRKKLEDVESILIGLGIQTDNIIKYASIDEFQEQGEALYISDLFLIEGRKEVSIDFLKEKIRRLQGNDKSQFIVMSYDHGSLLELFESIRSDEKISTARFKIIDKPNGTEKYQLLWKNGILQLDREYELIHAQEDLLKCLDANITHSLDKLKKSLWSLDASAFYRFYLTADADNTSLGEYFSELMMWHVLGVFEGNHIARDKLNTLQKGLKEQGPFVGPSTEVGGAVSVANNVLMDLVSYRPEWLTPVVEDNQLKTFLANLKFGGIYRENQTNKVYVHLTRPCDYLHAKSDSIDTDYLLFLNGLEIRSSDSLPKDGGTSVFTPYVNVNGKTKYYEWFLKRPFTTSISAIYEGFHQRFSLLGQIRHSFAIGLVNKYASSASEVAHLRLPYAEDIAAHHLYFSPDQQCFMIHAAEQEVKYENKESFNGRELNISFYFVHDKKTISVVFPYFSSSLFSYQYKTHADQTDDSRMEFSKKLMGGLQRKRSDIEYFTLLDDKSLNMCDINYFLENHDGLLDDAKKIFRGGKVIFNCLVYKSSN